MKNGSFKTLNSAEIKIERETNTLKLSTNKPAYFVDLFHPDLEFSDGGFILLPNENKVLNIIGNYDSININDIKISTLNNYLID